MNWNSSRQRKMVYLVGILVLLIPIIFLGMPSGGTRDGQQAGGGVLSKMRSKANLGESNLGEIDPSSATMNLVLLGLRGVAVSLLWQQMDDAKNNKDWAEMRAATESIIRLQPHYEKVWEYNAHNLAFNTSAEWDDVRDRWYWVKEGGKFMIKGARRNVIPSGMPYHVGNIYQKKVGLSDEKKFYRQFFKIDPDAASFGGNADPDFNPEGRENDSFLQARSWYQQANDREIHAVQHIEDRTIFRSKPARALFDYARALQEGGTFGEPARQAWAAALNEWTGRFGLEEFEANFRGFFGKFWMEMTEADISARAKSPDELEIYKAAVDQYQKMNNYLHWRTFGQFEAQPQSAQAHQAFFEAGEQFKAQNLQKAREQVLVAMTGFQEMLAKYPDLADDDLMAEECCLCVMLFKNINTLLGEPEPADYPLKSLYDTKTSMGNFLEMLEPRFNSRFIRLDQ